MLKSHISCNWWLLHVLPKVYDISQQQHLQWLTATAHTRNTATQDA